MADNTVTPMSRSEVVALMQSTTSEAEWNENCDIVKECNGGHYPPYWFESIILSGIACNVMEHF